MKKFIALLMVVILGISLCACGESSQDTKELYISEYNKITDLSQTCESICDVVIDVWEIVGADSAAACLSYMANVPDDFEAFWDASETPMEKLWQCEIAEEYGWLHNSSFGISLNTDAMEFHTICKDYKNACIKAEELNNEIEADIKSLRNTYGDKFESEFGTLNELYVEVSVFVDFSLNPSGSLISYTSDYKNYEQNIDKLSKAADIY